MRFRVNKVIGIDWKQIKKCLNNVSTNTLRKKKPKSKP